MINRIENICSGISTFITGQLDRDYKRCRIFYGHSFTLLFLKMRGDLSPAYDDILEKQFDSLDQTNPEFHWEFNNYALLQYEQLGGTSLKSYLENHKYKNTSCTNWSLLRACSKLFSQSDDALLEVEKVRTTLGEMQLHSGLIQDDPGVRSFQYHCFSAALCAEIYDLTGDDYFLTVFEMAVDFIRPFILPNGETLYIGRGQQQSFGYGALVFILAKAYEYFDDPTILGDIESVLSFIEEHKRPDGSFPLVLNDIEESIPTSIDMSNPEFVGWYPYNNYYDYLPFMAVFLEKASKVLMSRPHLNVEYRQQENYGDGIFEKVVTDNYISVVAAADGYWSNDQNLPYIYSKAQNCCVTPFFGGEQFQISLYSLTALPMPTWRSLSFRRKVKSFLVGNYHISLSIFGIYIQYYEYHEDGVEVSDLVISPLPFKSNFLFQDSCEIETSTNFRKLSDEYSGSGLLKRMLGGRMNKVKFMVKNES